ncbi:MAG TPA: hypothetical protein VE987_16595, partial [Polyangiaceae bacterium]|nr:hypothetical protein [Polyangiaceae bacterium]
GAADVPITEEARTHFAAGVALLRDPKAPRYEEAYREFKAAYAAAPSYRILGNLGLCAMKIERDGEAIQAYELYLKEAGFELTSEEREQIERDLLTLKAGNVQVTVSSDPPGATIVDVRTPVQGDEIRNAYGEVLTPLTLSLRHGHHVIRARLPGYVDQEWEFEAAGSTMPPHVFVMAKPPVVAAVEAPVVTERPVPKVAYATGAISLALAAGGAVTGALALKKHNDFNSLNDGNHVAAAESARSQGQTLNVLTDVLLGSAVLGAVVTLYVVATRPEVVVERAARRAVRRPVWIPTGAGATWTPGGGPVGSARWEF